jgi:hypothetical protein
MRALYSMIFSFVFLWIFAVWTIVGFLFWIPLLVRTISLIFAIMILIAISSSNTTGRSDLMKKLQKAIDFYLDGFASIYSTLNDVEYGYGSANNNDFQKRELDIDWPTVIIGTIFTLLFWFISLSFVFQDYTIFNIVGNAATALIFGIQSIIIPTIAVIAVVGIIVLTIAFFSQ